MRDRSDTAAGYSSAATVGLHAQAAQAPPRVARHGSSSQTGYQTSASTGHALSSSSSSSSLSTNDTSVAMCDDDMSESTVKHRQQHGAAAAAAERGPHRSQRQRNHAKDALKTHKKKKKRSRREYESKEEQSTQHQHTQHTQSDSDSGDDYASSSASGGGGSSNASSDAESASHHPMDTSSSSTSCSSSSLTKKAAKDAAAAVASSVSPCGSGESADRAAKRAKTCNASRVRSRPVELRLPLPFGSAYAYENLCPKEVESAMYERERVYQAQLRCDYLTRHRGLHPPMRSILLDWLFEVSQQFQLSRITAHMAIYFVDCFMSRASYYQKNMLQLVGITCLFIASKFQARVEECPLVADFVNATGDNCSANAILKMEKRVLNLLDWKLMPIPAVQWAHLYFQNAVLAAEEELEGRTAQLEQLEADQQQQASSSPLSSRKEPRERPHVQQTSKKEPATRSASSSTSSAHTHHRAAEKRKLQECAPGDSSPVHASTSAPRKRKSIAPSSSSSISTIADALSPKNCTFEDPSPSVRDPSQPSIVASSSSVVQKRFPSEGSSLTSVSKSSKDAAGLLHAAGSVRSDRTAVASGTGTAPSSPRLMSEATAPDASSPVLSSSQIGRASPSAPPMEQKYGHAVEELSLSQQSDDTVLSELADEYQGSPPPRRQRTTKRDMMQSPGFASPPLSPLSSSSTLDEQEEESTQLEESQSQLLPDDEHKSQSKSRDGQDQSKQAAASSRSNSMTAAEARDLRERLEHRRTELDGLIRDLRQPELYVRVMELLDMASLEITGLQFRPSDLAMSACYLVLGNQQAFDFAMLSGGRLTAPRNAVIESLSSAIRFLRKFSVVPYFGVVRLTEPYFDSAIPEERYHDVQMFNPDALEMLFQQGVLDRDARTPEKQATAAADESQQSQATQQDA